MFLDVFFSAASNQQFHFESRINVINVQVLIGDAAVELGIRSGHCHYGLVAALFILARHDSHGNAFHYSAMALQMLGGSAALDFLEDSAWPFSSLVPQLQG